MTDQRSLHNNLRLFGYCLLAFLLGIFFRLNDFSLQILADDEWHAINKLLGDDFVGIFTSFGHADHSIPLTLFYASLAKLIPLSEHLLRAPLLIAGLAAILAIPWMLKSRLSVSERGWLALLLALSPILIYFSRTARPYALTVLLAFAALIIFFLWFRERKRYQAVLYILFATLCAWLQPITLTILVTPFVYFGAGALYRVVVARDVRDLVSLFFLGLGLLLFLGLSIGPPLANDYASLAVKSGVDNVSFGSLYVSLQLLVGSSHTIFIVVWLALVLLGLYRLFARDPLFAGYLLFALLFSVLFIVLSRAAWIHHPLVTARYALPILPILLLLTAIGLAEAVQRIACGRGWAALVASIPILIAVYLGGPLPAQYHQSINQFTGHMAYQFDYDWQRNVYNQALDNQPVSPFYEELARQAPRSRHIVLVPWYMEWHWNRWYLDQAVHQQRVSAGFLSGFCVEQRYGEYSSASPKVDMENVRHLSDMSDASVHEAWSDVDFLVYHKRKPREDLDLELPAECLQRIRDVFRESYYEDDILVVFKVKQ